MELFRREWLEEFGSDHQFAFQNAELSAAFAASDRNQPNDGFIAPGNNDLLS
jgi:hypothetical protein